MDKVKSENVDHIYCNKLKSKDNLSFLDFKKSIFISNDNTVKKMKNFILTNINLIEELQNQLLERDALIAKLIAENDGLKQKFQRFKKSNKKIDQKDSNITNTCSTAATTAANNNTKQQPVNKSTKSTGGSKKSETKEKSTVSYDTSDDESSSNAAKKSPDDAQDQSISIKLSRKNLFLMTDKPYVSLNWKTLNFEDEELLNNFDDINVNLEVPRWTVVGSPNVSPRRHDIDRNAVEDISDEAILKRHGKLEIDERRRKKWDAQRIREQKNIERLRKRHLKEEYPELVQPPTKVVKTITSFFPNPETIKFIQISDDLPVSAFGEQIPKLQPKDFSIPWLTPETDDSSNIYSIDQMLSSSSREKLSCLKMRTKFISRCSRPMTK